MGAGASSVPPPITLCSPHTLPRYLLSKYVKIKSEPIIASELQFAPETIEEDSVLIAISQSGESADVLEAVRIAKKSNIGGYNTL